MDADILLEHFTLGTLKSGICRVCLLENKVLTSIFNHGFKVADEVTQIQTVLEEVTSLQLHIDDGFPAVICSKCLDEANKAYNFKMKYQKSNTTLTNCLESIYEHISNAANVESEPYQIQDGAIFLILPEKEIFIIEKAKDDKEQLQYFLDDFDMKNEEAILGTSFFYNGNTESKNNLVKLEEDELLQTNELDSLSIDSNLVKFMSDNRESLMVPEIDPEYLYDCTMCYQSFWSKNDLQSHKVLHPINSRHFCRICNKSYKRSNMLRIHMVKHNSNKDHVCPICRAAFYYKKNLNKHMCLHGERVKFTCDHCGRDYKYLSGLEEHIRFEHMGEQPAFMCDVCGALMRSSMTLKLHKKIHSHVKKLNFCKYCKKTYNNDRYFKNHVAKHERNSQGYVKPTPVKLFICDYCGKEHNVKEYLKRHILIEHFNLRKFKCNECGKAFRTGGNLKEHRVVHTRERPEQCDICGNRFVSKIALKLHQRLHSGERPYSCEFCGERFLSSSRRLAHMKSKHMEKQEQCPICFRKYYLRSTLNQHMLSHTKPATVKNRKKIKHDTFTVEYPMI